ncbi:hypothetical protein EBAPG3_010445 [Nitrosospira lacus]|uniref:Uncharacterized protein n=1 Tax=Nitrosospira lacus TaxID=1288494 RepID=A0A1W6SQU3_9PROT|nr:hypothetical protein [Nitrosospira lacus]ARO88161.3 hypothetical protein EBAPG3_010445 [Nitrosospira lacus]
MPIVSSQIISQSVQVDGRTDVLERHTDHNGVDHDCPYTAAVGLDINVVMTLRAQNIGARIDMLELAEAEANNFELSLSQVEFLKRFTQKERTDVNVAKRTDAEVEDAWNFVMAAKNGIHLRNPLTIGMLALLEAKLLLDPGRKEIIGAP